MSQKPILQMNGICKNFGAVKALQNVDFEILPGEVVGLVGDNGAGKYTLIKIISGVEHFDEGTIIFEDQEVNISNPEIAKELGIETLYQDLALIHNLDVAANLHLGREKYNSYLFGLIKVLKNQEMEKDTVALLDRLQINLGSIREKVDVLSGGQRQAIALSRAVGWGKKLVLLDEPTAALGVRESKQAVELIRRLKDQNIATVVISHNLEHVFSVVDRIVVLRQGIIRGERGIEDADVNEIVSMITGADELKKGM
ncbi:MAG: ATP-binding cassette domain-containing protein [Anaerolineaceae bacterium]|nr:ATP-binding cassette domain-containing protein [Anaerolineaceae bacterium]